MLKIGIIPVRSGSKRFPGKNFKNFNGTTLLRNTIDKLILSKQVDKIIISTDDIEKAKAAVGLIDVDRNSIIYMRRPVYLSNDEAQTETVIAYIIEKLNIPLEYIVILSQVTSPNWSPHRLTYAINKLEDKKLDTVISISPDLKPNGAFYVFYKTSFIKQHKIYSNNMYLVKMSWEESTDIDFEYQLNLAEAISRGNHD